MTDFLGIKEDFKMPQKKDSNEAKKKVAKASGEACGFVDRSGKKEVVAPQEQKKRIRKKEPQGQIFIQGSRKILDQFVDHCNDHDLSYCKALEQLMNK